MYSRGGHIRMGLYGLAGVRRADLAGIYASHIYILIWPKHQSSESFISTRRSCHQLCHHLDHLFNLLHLAVRIPPSNRPEWKLTADADCTMSASIQLNNRWTPQMECYA